MLVRAFTAAVTAVLLMVGGGSAARASIGDNLPPGANPEAWGAYVQSYRAGPDWSPRGTAVADTQFRSFPHGFSFFNTSVPDFFNNELFGTPLEGPPNLDAQTMRDLLGKRVCVEKSATGPCTLTLAGAQWMRSTNQSMTGGHCFGLASTAAELFNGSLQPSQFQPGATRTYDLGLQDPISRRIARNMAAQYTFDVMDYAASPRTVVSRLQEALVPGSMPFTLFILWPGGGHALTPYAVHDLGGGRYDIAVYDNNYPDAQRAIRVNTRTDTYRYLVATNPNGTPEIARDVIGLIPTSAITGKQKCPFCPAANETTVQLTPVRSDVPITTRITDPDGNRIKGVVVNPPTNPWKPGQKWEFPTYTIPPKQPFIITVDNAGNGRPITTSLLATTGQFTIGTEGARIPGRGTALLGLIPTKGVVVYTSNGRQRTLGALVFVDESPSAGVQVSARTGGQGDQLLLGRFNEKNQRVVLFTPTGEASPARASAILQYADETGAGTLSADAEVTIPPKGRLVIDYSGWTSLRPKGLKAYLQSGGVRTPVRVTTSLR